MLDGWYLPFSGESLGMFSCQGYHILKNNTKCESWGYHIFCWVCWVYHTRIWVTSSKSKLSYRGHSTPQQHQNQVPFLGMSGGTVWYPQVLTLTCKMMIINEIEEHQFVWKNAQVNCWFFPFSHPILRWISLTHLPPDPVREAISSSKELPAPQRYSSPRSSRFLLNLHKHSQKRTWGARLKKVAQKPFIQMICHIPKVVFFNPKVCIFLILMSCIKWCKIHLCIISTTTMQRPTDWYFQPINPNKNGFGIITPGKIKEYFFPKNFTPQQPAIFAKEQIGHFLIQLLAALVSRNLLLPLGCGICWLLLSWTSWRNPWLRNSSHGSTSDERKCLKYCLQEIRNYHSILSKNILKMFSTILRSYDLLDQHLMLPIMPIETCQSLAIYSHFNQYHSTQLGRSGQWAHVTCSLSMAT